MRNFFANQSLSIVAGHVVSGVTEQQRTLQVDCGKVWITIEGSPHDYWLVAGESVDVTAGRLIVIEADHVDSRITIPTPACDASALARVLPALGSAARLWLRGSKTTGRPALIDSK